MKLFHENLEIPILDILTTQRKIRNYDQIKTMIEVIDDLCLPPLTIYSDDHSFALKDGHHRLIAYYLGGKTHIGAKEANIFYEDFRFPTFGNVISLIERIKYKIE